MRTEANCIPMTVRGAIVDLDGTVYRGGSLLPGVREGIDAMRGAGLDLLFFSNNPTKDGNTYVDHLRDLGLEVRAGEACSAGVTTTEYLQAHHGDEAVLCIGATPLREQLRAADVRLTDDPVRADVVLASWTPDFGYDDLVTAIEALDDETVFLGTDPDRTFPEEDGKMVPGSGAIVYSVAATVQREPDAVLGKPSDIATTLALDRLGTGPRETLVVGDRLDTDLAMGKRVGMTTVLVLTGIATREDIPDSSVDPDYVLDSLGDIGDVLDGLQ